MKEFFDFASESPILTFFLFLIVFGSCSSAVASFGHRCDCDKKHHQEEIEK